MSPDRLDFTIHADPAIAAASARARETFRYFWREVSWEQRRIVPGLDLAVAQFRFTDEGADRGGEFLWCEELDHDGRFVHGTVLNAPNGLEGVAKGDRVVRPVGELTDWLLAHDGVAYGAFTVQVLRGRLGFRERRAHDRAWGLDFGSPDREHVTPPWFADLEDEHPMAVNARASLEDALRDDPTLAHTPVDAQGLTLLHRQVLAGDANGVEVLLAHGAEPDQATFHGVTARAMAGDLGWPRVQALLAAVDPGA